MKTTIRTIFDVSCSLSCILFVLIFQNQSVAGDVIQQIKKSLTFYQKNQDFQNVHLFVQVDLHGSNFKKLKIPIGNLPRDQFITFSCNSDTQDFRKQSWMQQCAIQVN